MNGEDLLWYAHHKRDDGVDDVREEEGKGGWIYKNA